MQKNEMMNLYDYNLNILAALNPKCQIVKNDEDAKRYLKEEIGNKTYKSNLKCVDSFFFKKDENGIYKIDVALMNKANYNSYFKHIVLKNKEIIEKFYNNLENPKSLNPNFELELNVKYNPKEIKKGNMRFFAEYQSEKADFKFSILGTYELDFNGVKIEVKNPVILKGEIDYYDELIVEICKYIEAIFV